MPLVASTIPNLVSGVSQQPAPSRLRTSGSEMINGFPTVVSGLMKRPPTEFVSKLDASALDVSDTTAVHTIDRDANEKYILVAGEGGLALFDQAGVPQTISYPNGKAYLPTSDMWQKLRFVTVADTTFILNTEKVVEANYIPETDTAVATRAIVAVKEIANDHTYVVQINGQTAASYKTKNFVPFDTVATVIENLRVDLINRGYTGVEVIGTSISFSVANGSIISLPTETDRWVMTAFTETYSTGYDEVNRPNPKTKGTVFVKQAVASVAYAVYVGENLVGSMTTSPNTEANNALEGTSEIARQIAASMRGNGYSTAISVGPTVSFDVPEGARVSVADEFGGRAMTVYTDTVQEFEDLPPSEIEGRLVKVAGNLDATAGTAYWVSYSDGIWTETVGYEARREFDVSTMPHVLKKLPNGTFEFRQHDWKGRGAGDDDSNPDPTFVGSRVNGMFLFKGRLGFLSEENVILSAVAVFEDLYRTTVVQQLASDVIDVASATGRVSTLYHAASFSDELVLFSDKQQFRLSSSTILSAETVGITNSTAYPCSLYVSPVVVGSSAFFIADGATHSIAREIFIDEGRETVNGEDIAVQVPFYVPKNIRGLTASPTADVFLMLSQDDPSTLYLYKWYTSENRKIQSAWCKWTFDPLKKILGTGFLDNYLYIVYLYDGELRLDRMLVGTIIDKDFLLDSQFTHEDCIQTGDTYTMPYAWSGDLMVIDNDTGGYLEVNRLNDTDFEIVGALPTLGFTAGINYEFRYEFSTQYLREDTSDGEGSIQDGRLQMRYYSVIYTATSYFEAWVTDISGVTRKTIYNGRVLADPDNLADVIPKDTGEFKFPVFGQNDAVKIELVNDQPYRCAFGSVEWTAMYQPKAKRV